MKKPAERRKMFMKFYTVSAIVSLVLVFIGLLLIVHGDNLSERALDAGMCGNRVCTSGNEVAAFESGNFAIYKIGLTLFLAGITCFVVSCFVVMVFWFSCRKYFMKKKP